MSHTNLTVYGAVWCEHCKRAKKFLGEQRVHYNWVDIEQNADGQTLVDGVVLGEQDAQRATAFRQVRRG